MLKNVFLSECYTCISVKSLNHYTISNIYIQTIDFFLRAFAPVVATLRPKGLGLGADLSEAKQTNWKGEEKSKDKDEEVLTFKKGAFCVVTKGANKDLYGEVRKPQSHIFPLKNVNK